MVLDKIITKYNNLFVLWVLLAGIAAYFFPTLFTPLKKYMELFFAITMFGVGMVLDPKSFIDIVKNFKVVVIGVLAQFSIMPFSAFIVSKVFALSKDFSLGLILAGSAPGAMASNVLCYLAGADVAYSVSLTTASTLLAPVLTPLLTLFLAHTILDIPFWNMFWSVTRMVLIPLVIGILIKRLFNKKIEPITKIFPAISTTFIAFICALVIALNKTFILQMSAMIFLAAIVLNIAGLFIGYNIGRLSKFDLLKKRALAIEIGMQNAGLGSVLALKHFNEKVALPAVVFVFVCIFTASLLVPIWARKANE